MLEVAIGTDAGRITDADLAHLYESVGFGTAASYLAIEGLLGRLTRSGSYCIFATTSGSRLVGLVRLLSDDLLTSWIAELCVHPDCQRNGIGSALIEAAVRRFGHTAIYTDAFDEAVSLFAKHGIGPKKKLTACSRRSHAKPHVAH